MATNDIFDGKMAIQHLDDTESPKAAIDSLFKSQKYVAKLMEISFYIIGDFPELFSEVRSSASRTWALHQSTLAMMKTFITTGKQMVESTIPYFSDFVDEGQYGVAEKYVHNIIDGAMEMKVHVKKVISEYKGITKKLQDYISSVGGKHEVLQEEWLAQQAREMELDELEKENLKLLRSLPSMVETYHKTVVDLLRIITSLESDFGDFFSIVPVIPTTKKTMKQQLLVKRTTVLEQARNELKRIGDLSQQHKKIENKQEDIRNEIQAQSRSLKDVSGLRDAATNLSKANVWINQQADIYLVELLIFWDNVADKLLTKSADDETSSESIQQKHFAKEVNSVIEEGRKKMDELVAVCTDYVLKCEGNIDSLGSISSLYGFLDEGLHSTSKEQRQDLIKQKQEELDGMMSIVEQSNI